MKHQPTQLRIVGGELRGRKFQYAGDPRVRPMKDRVREALFNLAGPSIIGMHAVDLFGGTGAVGFEAVSRGAVHADIVEMHLPTLRVIQANASHLKLNDRVTIHHANAFRWIDQWNGPSETPWAVFCCPPYALFDDQLDAFVLMLTTLAERAPAGSMLAVESDKRVCFEHFPMEPPWDIRAYPPAVIGMWWKG
jgi:16S rRNA (guanine966-N2)-methyltransferase